MRALIDRLASGNALTDGELLTLITMDDPDAEAYLAQKADAVRRQVYGNRVFIRGLIEFTNHCRNNCHYCGIRRSNPNCQRYRLSTEEILACCDAGYRLGFRTFVLQGGEDPFFTPPKITELVRAIKNAHPDCAVTLALGERSRESYERLFNAGADRYLMRHECADRGLYESLHPAEMSWENRMHCLNVIKELGYQSGCGFIVGLPGQTAAHLAEDLNYIEEYAPHMVDISPFIPQPGTPFADAAPGDRELTEYLLSIIRLILPGALILAEGIDGILAVLGGAVTLGAEGTYQLSPAIIVNGKLTYGTPAADFTYESASSSVATVGEHTGLITAAGTGDTEITVTYEVGDTTYTDYVNVTVSGS